MIASNLGVLVGLVFVGIEVRNSGNSVTAQSAIAITAGYNEWNYAVASDPDLSKIVYLGFRDPDSLTDAEAYRAALMITGIFNQYFELHTLFKSGVLTDAQWVRTATDINRVVKLPGARVFLEHNSTFDQDFLDDVSKFAEEGSENARTLGRDPFVSE